MSQKILIPLDGSSLGEEAISYVKDLVGKFSVKQAVTITLFHVITVVRHHVGLQGGTAMSIPYTEDELGKMKEEALDYLKTVGKALENDNVSVNYKVAVSETPATAIIEVEEEVGADLVAMSTHGRSGFSRFVIGSIAEKVMRGGTVPVLMVRANEE